MESSQVALEHRLRVVERKLRVTQLVALAVLAVLLATAAGGRVDGSNDVTERIRARRIDVVDADDVVRISLGQDPKDTQRRSRACGITLHDAKGDERGGMGTMDDLSAVIALDAPAGVGHSMRDRVGMMVSPDGSAQVVLIDNQARAPVRLVTDAQGGGALELAGDDLEKKTSTRKRVDFAGETATHAPLEQGK